MGRLIIAGILMTIVMIAIVSSLSHGFLSRISHMSRRELVVLLAALCLVSAASWLYFHGDLEYFFWEYEAPTRPADERTFVDRVQEARDTWSAATDPATQASTCSQQTAKIASLAASVDNWSGIVSTTYLIGRQAVLVVQIGQSVLLRTPYNVSETGPFIEQGTQAFDRVITLKTGDVIKFSGGLVIDSKQCLFNASSSQQKPETELLFKFAAVKSP